MGISLVAAVIAIADFFKDFIKYKLVILVLAVLLSVNVIYLFHETKKQNAVDLVASEMKKSAKVVADSILITGWEESGDYLGYLTQITGFYTRYKTFFPTEADIYSAELNDWREYFSEKRKARETIYLSEIAPLKGLVQSGEEHMENISSEGS